MATITIHDLRNRFPEIRKIVEAEGEVIVTDRGEPRYRLTLYTPVPSRKAPAGKDYVARMKRHQPLRSTRRRPRFSMRRTVATAEAIYADPPRV